MNLNIRAANGWNGFCSVRFVLGSLLVIKCEGTPGLLDLGASTAEPVCLIHYPPEDAYPTPLRLVFRPALPATRHPFLSLVGRRSEV